MNTERMELAAAKVVLNLLLSTELPKVALDAMVDGCESPSLEILAGLTKAQSADARDLFDRALVELRIPMPSKREAAQRLACEAGQSILDGAVTPYEGARSIWKLSVLSDENIPELDPFEYAASEWEDRPADRTFFENAIVDVARDLAKTCICMSGDKTSKE